MKILDIMGSKIKGKMKMIPKNKKIFPEIIMKLRNILLKKI